VSDARVVDALGTHCPVPVQLLARALARVTPGAVVRVLADDPMVAVDLPAWCHSHGHELVAFGQSDGVWTAIVRHRPPVGA
jgi:TusA-related sulfurtransferase